jgi:hypothetical protein
MKKKENVIFMKLKTPENIMMILFVFYSLSLLFFGNASQLRDDSFSSYPLFSLPEISYADVLSLDPFTIKQLVTHLTTSGTVQISGIPKFEQARKDALENAASCLKTHENSAGKRIMDDGSIRLSSGAMTTNGQRGQMSVNSCSEQSETLRSIIDSVSRQIFLSLDTYISEISFKLKTEKSSVKKELSLSLIMEPSYHSFSDLISYGNHLEHLHAFYPSSSEEQSTSKNDFIPTLDFHTDNGLMIAMTTGYYQTPTSSSPFPSSQNGLYMMLPDGKKVKAEMSDSSLILLVGEGGMNWFAPVLDGKPLRAVPHALIVDLPVKDSRSWFGKMLLPPGNAYLSKEKMTYEEYHRLETSPQYNPSSSSASYIPLACAAAHPDLLTVSHSLQSNNNLILQNVQCSSDPSGQPGVFCWMTVRFIFFFRFMILGLFFFIHLVLTLVFPFLTSIVFLVSISCEYVVWIRSRMCFIRNYNDCS